MKTNETAKTTPASTAAPTVAEEPKIKATPVEERKYKLAEAGKPMAFKGKQRQIVFDVLLASKNPLTISEVAKAAEEKGLRAIGGVEPSCRYHLHHLTKDGVTSVENPTITIE
jgi:hypothetical protein